MKGIEGILLDVDGVLAVSWKPIPRAPEAIAWLRKSGVPFRLMTNTTTHSRSDLAETLRAIGLDIDARDVITAPLATGSYLRSRHRGARCFLLGERNVAEDLQGVQLVEDDADVVVVAGADESFTWENLNRAFRMLVDGASLVAMHRNLYWMTDEGLKLDAGAFVAGLEQAAGVEAAVTGKPSPEFFREGVDQLGVPRERAAMVGDDLQNDVLAAQAAGLTGILVRTGKSRAETLADAGEAPHHVIDSVADLPELLGAP